VALIGLVADTHCERQDGSDLPRAVLRAFEAVDLILHCGDLMTLGVLDRLRAVAPVAAVRSRADPAAEHEALCDPPRLVEVDGLGVGLLSRPSDLPALAGVGNDARTDIGRLRPRLPELFGRTPDVVCYRGSHRDQLHLSGGTLFIDPGSPTFWSGRRASVALLALESGSVEVSVLDITSRIGPRHRLARREGVIRQWWWERKLAAQRA
jgi:uncharacterized protein